MTLLPEQEDQIRRYLLGVATPDEAEQVETDLLRGDENVERMLLIEDELITDYALGALGRRERKLLEKNFFSTPERRNRLMIAHEMVKQASAYGEAGMAGEMNGARANNESGRAQQLWNWLIALIQPGQSTRTRWKIAAYATLVIGLGLGIWGFLQGIREPEVGARLEKGMVALNQAYRERRLVKARITELPHSPFRETRGGPDAEGEQDGVDLPARRRAFDLLDDAVRENPTAAEARHTMGRFYLARKNFDDAIAEFEAALRTAPNNARLHSDLGAALMEKSDLEASRKSGRDPRTIDRCLEHLNRAIELDASLLEPLFNRALLRQSLGQLFQAKEDWDNYLKKDSTSPWAEEARRNLKLIEERNKRVAQRGDELFVAFQQAHQAGDETQVWSVFSRSHFLLGNHITSRLIDEKLAFAKEGREQGALARWQVLSDLGALAERKSGDRYVADLARVYRPSSVARARALAEARSLFKDAYKDQSDSRLSQAIPKYGQAQAIFRRQGAVGEAMLSEYRIGYCYLQQADMRRSMESFNEVIQASEARGYKWLQSLALNGLANAQARLTDYSNAIPICRRAIQLAREIGDENGKLRSLSVLTGFYERLGKLREAWRIAQECLGLSEKIVADQSQVVTFYSISARCFYSLGLYSASLDYAREALRLAETMKSPWVMSRYLTNTGLVYARLGKYEEAIEYIKRGMQIGQSAQPEALAREMTAHTALFLGQTYRLSGAGAEAAAMIEQAADFCREKDDPLLLQRVAKERLMGQIASGEEAEARNSLRSVIAIYEEMRARIPDESDRSSFFAREQSVYDIAIDFTAARPDGAREAFEYSETSRARSLLDAFHNRQQTGAIGGIPEPRFSGVASPLTLSEIQSRMPERTQLLQYAALEDKLIIWLVTPRRFEQITVKVPLSKLTGLATDYLAQISGPDGGDKQRWRRKAEELYDVLLQPVAPLIEPNKQICVVPDKILNRLPYGALISTATGRYLIEDYLPNYAPSASLFVLCAEEANRKSGQAPEHLLSVGNPSFDRRDFPDLEDLPAAARESEEIIKFYPSHQLLVGPNAKKRAVLREMERAEVIHFATHYDPNPTSPLFSRLALAAENETGGQASRRKGALLVGEIYRLDLSHGRLAVLSACQTWAEDYLHGEGAVGVSRPFLAAGVPVVVSSLWKIDSPATRNMMIEFHRIRRTQKLPSAEALRAAQLGMLRGTEPAYRHPYYWASFIVAGGTVPEPHFPAKGENTFMPEHSHQETSHVPLGTLLKNPSVTIYLDGLMVLCYDKDQKRLQAGIHTDAHFHAMTITVRERGQSKDLQCLCLEHNQIEEIAPFFLYVEKKEGSRTPNGAVTLHKPDDPKYRQAFANVLDLQSESFHKRDRLRIKPNKLAPLNILNGEFYSATLGKATRKNPTGDSNPLNLGLVSTRVAGDISHTSGNLILRSKDPKAKPLIRLPLSGEKHYEVTILNEPEDDHKMDADHAHDHPGDRVAPNGEPRENHFNVYYEALVLRDGAMKYEVNIEEGPRSIPSDIGITPLFLPDDPPCELVWVSGISQLPDFPHVC